MTPKEALTLLNDMEFAEKYQGKDEYTDMLLMCKSALEKQIPKKVSVVGRRYWGEAKFGYCDCGCGVNSTDNQYCNKCGQALDWGDSE